MANPLIRRRKSIFKMATDLLANYSTEKLTKIALLGFSDGANLAMVFAISTQSMQLHDFKLWQHGTARCELFSNRSNLAISDRLALFPFSKGMRGFLPILGLLFRPISGLSADLNTSVPMILVGKRDSIKLSPFFLYCKQYSSVQFYRRQRTRT